MNTCGTCKYKTDDPENNARLYPDMIFSPGEGWLLRDCKTPVACDEDGNPLPIKTFFLCGRVKHKDRTEDAEIVGTKALVVDGSGYYAALCVDDDFGCALWEAK